MKLMINDEYHDVFLSKVDNGIDLCIDALDGRRYIARLTSDGELVLYQDVNKCFHKNAPKGTIFIRDEFDV